MLTLVVDRRQADAVVDRLIQFADHPAVLMNTIGEYLLESTQDRFTEKVSPDGVPWAPVTEAYAARKQAGKATGSRGDARTTNPDDLLRLRFQMVENLYRGLEGEHTLVIGSPEPYAAAHQFGVPSRNLPARPFLGLSERDAAEVKALTVDQLEGLIGG